MSSYIWFNPGGEIDPIVVGVPDATSSSKGIVQLAGDLAGTADSPNVIRINGTNFPAGGALTTDSVLKVTGISTAVYGALNLASSAAVSGLLPTANQVAQSLGGDLSGTTSAATVSKLRGTTISTAAGSLTTGQVIRVTGVSTIDYGALDLTNVSAVTGILPSTNLPSANASNLGLVKLAGDLSGTSSVPTVISLTGSGGIVTTSASIENIGLENNSATVLSGELIRAKKTISLIHGSTGNFDTTVWQTPTRFRVLSCIIRFATNVTLGALGAATLSLGVTTGGIELMALYTVLGTETTSTIPVGALTSQLGTDLVSIGNFQKLYMTAQTISLRAAVTAGSVTAGSVEIELVGYQF